MVFAGHTLLQYPELNSGLNPRGIRRFGLYVFFGFSIDYLFRDKRFFKSKYYRIQLFGFGVLILSFGFIFIGMSQAALPMMAALALIGISYVAWAFDQHKITFLIILKAIFCLALIGYWLLSFLHLPDAGLSLLVALLACLLANTLQFINERPEFKKRLKI